MLKLFVCVAGLVNDCFLDIPPVNSSDSDADAVYSQYDMLYADCKFRHGLAWCYSQSAVNYIVFPEIYWYIIYRPSNGPTFSFFFLLFYWPPTFSLFFTKSSCYSYFFEYKVMKKNSIFSDLFNY